MNPFEIDSLGLHPMLTYTLQEMRREGELESMPLTLFLGEWHLYNSLQYEDDEPWICYRDYVEAIAKVGDTGANIAKMSNASAEELFELAMLPDPSEYWRIQERFVHRFVDTVNYIFDGPPATLQHGFAFYQYARESDLVPAGINSILEKMNVKVTLDDVYRQLRVHAAWAFCTGIATTAFCPEFYNNLPEFRHESETKNRHFSYDDSSRWILRSELQLAQCKVWANLCRPDMKRLLEPATQSTNGHNNGYYSGNGYGYLAA